MQLLRPSAARGLVATAFGDRRHAFSSASFHDPGWLGWGALRLASEDRFDADAVAPPGHHANIEVLRLVVEGTLAGDGPGGGAEVLSAGDWQWLGGGHGRDDPALAATGGVPARLLQFWLQPDRLNAAPADARHRPDPAACRDGWATIASPDGSDGGLPLRLGGWLRGTLMAAGATRAAVRDPARRHWMQVVAGRVAVDGAELAAGDALAIAGEAGALTLRGAGQGDAHVLWFDLPGA